MTLVAEDATSSVARTRCASNDGSLLAGELPRAVRLDRNKPGSFSVEAGAPETLPLVPHDRDASNPISAPELPPGSDGLELPEASPVPRETPNLDPETPFRPPLPEIPFPGGPAQSGPGRPASPRPLTGK